jgi:hypothetical protein
MPLHENFSEGDTIDDLIKKTFKSAVLRNEARGLLWDIEDNLKIDIPLEYLVDLVELLNGHLNRFIKETVEIEEKILLILRTLKNFVDAGNRRLPNKHTFFELLSAQKGKGKPHNSSVYTGNGHLVNTPKQGSAGNHPRSHPRRLYDYRVTRGDYTEQ